MKKKVATFVLLIWAIVIIRDNGIVRGLLALSIPFIAGVGAVVLFQFLYFLLVAFFDGFKEAWKVANPFRMIGEAFVKRQE